MKTKNLRLLFFIFLLAGCGDDMGSPPVLTDIVYRNSKVYEQGFNDGEAIWSGRVSFEDPDGDVAVLSVSWQDCGLGPVKTVDYVQRDLHGISSGFIVFSILISTNCAIGEYAVKVSASDAQGNRSNLLEAPYNIREPVEPSQ